MLELYWFLIGAAAAIIAAWLLRARAASRSERGDDHQRRAIATTISPESHELAISMSEELASVASAVEARTQHLIEAAPSRAQLPGAAEALLATVKRLRHLHKKLTAFGGARSSVA